MKKKKKQRKHQLRRLSPAMIILCIAAGAALAGLGWLLQFELLAQEDQRIPEPPAKVLISELMSSNSGVLDDGSGQYPDWIEIVNRDDRPVDLTGWQLLTGDQPLSPFTFPAMTLQPGEHAVIFASGQEQSSTMNAPFKLSASGETVLLADAHGVQADKVVLPDMESDQSYALNAEDEWEKTAYCTPGMENRRENAITTREVVSDAICLSEVIPLNATLGEGGSDLIELTNVSRNAVSLKGYCLTDNPADRNKYILDDIILQPGEYMLIKADGKNAPFRLSSDGEQLMLLTPEGKTAGYAEWGAMEADHSLSFADGEWTQLRTPTPGFANTPEGAAAFDRQLTENNTSGLFISEVLASGSEDTDWVELYNAGSSTMNLMGYGLSDDPQSPRKWQFPSDFTIGPGEYKVVYLSGRDTLDRYGRLHTDFSLSCTNPETLTLCLPDGQIIDRAFMPQMYGDVSIGRKSTGGFAYLAKPTRREENSDTLYDSRADKPVFSVAGGLFEAGDSVQLSISSPEGLNIYYTLDSSDPTEDSLLYTGPITLTGNTVVRAAAMGRGVYPSYIETQTYLFGVSHTTRIVSVVSDPEGLFSEKTGIMASAKGASASNDYEGANFWEEWERGAHVEIFETDGTTMISQGCSVKLHGANSRKRAQKALALTARMSYDEDNRFRAALFDDREYTEYHSFILRAGGQDGEMSRIRDTLIDQLAADAGIYYQESELCVVYLNGEYWGQYDMREKINRFSIADYEGWDDAYHVTIVRNADYVVRGSDQTYADLMEYIKSHKDATDEDIAHVESVVDLDNYLNWISLMIYSGNQDIGIRRYLDAANNGLWKWAVFDMDYAFYNDTDSMRRWLDPAGAGAHNASDNRLFVYVMKNEKVQDRFLTRFGELVTGPWAAEKMVEKIDALYQEMLPEMEAHFKRWTMISMKEWQEYIDKIRAYAATREEKIIGYTQKHLNLTADEMIRYFGEEWSAD